MITRALMDRLKTECLQQRHKHIHRVNKFSSILFNFSFLSSFSCTNMLWLMSTATHCTSLEDSSAVGKCLEEQEDTSAVASSAAGLVVTPHNSNMQLTFNNYWLNDSLSLLKYSTKANLDCYTFHMSIQHVVYIRRDLNIRSPQ